MSDSILFDSVMSGRPRVLVVENERVSRELYGELLQKWGYEPILVEAEGRQLVDQAFGSSDAERSNSFSSR